IACVAMSGQRGAWPPQRSSILDPPQAYMTPCATHGPHAEKRHFRTARRLSTTKVPAETICASYLASWRGDKVSRATRSTDPDRDTVGVGAGHSDGSRPE